MPVKGNFYLIKPNAKKLWEDELGHADWNPISMDILQGRMCEYMGKYSETNSLFKHPDNKLTYFFPNFCVEWDEKEEEKGVKYYPSFV